jgi:transcriptional regulator with XRE-family HTH domain
MLKIGTKLLQLRNEYGYSQDEVADKIGMSQGNYSKLESDKHESFPGEILPVLAELYGIKIEDLIQKGDNQHINLSKNKKNAINAFLVYQDSKKQQEELNTSLKETIASQKETIMAQKAQIEILNAEILRLKNEK